MKLRSLLSTALPALLFASTAHAVRQPSYLDERPLETANGARGRVQVRTSAQTPATARAAWRSFTVQHGSWRAVWDTDTAVPRVVFGKDIAAPGAMADAAVAADAAYRLLGEHLALLAPGAQRGDFVVGHNVLHTHGAHPMRIVSMEQRWNGLRVVGGGALFLFKNDRLFVFGSTASPAIRAIVPSTIVLDAVASNEASRWIEDAYGAAPTITKVDAPVLLPVMRERGAIEHRVVVPVTADLASPRALWTVYVDAATGAPVARTQRLLFAEGTLRFNAGVRQPSGERLDYPAQFSRHTIAGTQVTANVAGLLTWTGAAAATVTTSVAGTYVRVTNEAGAEATTSLTLDPDGSAIWNDASTEFVDAQLSSYIHATIAKRYAIDTLDPSLGWLSQQMLVAVNEDDICNAYSNLDDIHFFRAGSTQGFTCENTGRLADVVYHEFGHSIHGQSIVHSGEFDGALSEGISDYYAATITGDPAMGLGFFSPTEPLRHIDPAGSEMMWPDDVSPFDPHVTGEIIAGALWDLRKELVAELGEAPGVALSDDIFYAIISRSVDIPSSYAIALAEDDDDGNLDNATPHQCAIEAGFAAHGLATNAAGEVIDALPKPTQLGFQISLAPPYASDFDCPGREITDGVVRWQLRDDLTVNGEVALTVGADGTATATIPTQQDGAVVQYQLDVTLSDGMTERFPSNDADPFYEMFVGPVEEITCFDFEGGLDGWTVSGDFEQGNATAGVSDDAPVAYSGAGVLGTKLGEDYSFGMTSTATSPAIDVSGFEGVRLHYRRWLNVEDATYDRATIAADGSELWTNLATDQGETTHTDREWRFQDVDLSGVAADGSVQLTFGLSTDQGLEFGGWNIDDVCVVARGAAVCGDGFVTAPERCDDGNTDDGDGCSAVCETETPAECPEGEVCEEDPSGCCSTGSGAPAGPLALGLLTLGLVLRRRRR